MESQVDASRLQAISAMLSREICRPIDSLQANLVQLLEEPGKLPSETERSHAATMLTLCEELRRLTQDCLGEESQPAEGAGVIARSAGSPAS